MPLEVAANRAATSGLPEMTTTFSAFLCLRGLGEVVAAGDHDGRGRVRVDEDDLVVEGGVLAVQPDAHAGAVEAPQDGQAARLVLPRVADQLHRHAALRGLRERGGDAPVGEEVGLHLDRVPRAPRCAPTITPATSSPGVK